MNLSTAQNFIFYKNHSESLFLDKNWSKFLFQYRSSTIIILIREALDVDVILVQFLDCFMQLIFQSF